MVVVQETPYSVRFFERQFQQQLHDADQPLNPFEQLALPYLRGRVLDHGCGLGHLTLAAARQGCRVLALDASEVAIGHLRAAATREGLPIEAGQADLRTHVPEGEFDAIACIGLLMFFDRATAMRQLHRLQESLRPGGVFILNVLVVGTTYLDMFDPQEHHLFRRDELPGLFAGWRIDQLVFQDFPAPQGLCKSFATLVAVKPATC